MLKKSEHSRVFTANLQKGHNKEGIIKLSEQETRQETEKIYLLYYIVNPGRDPGVKRQESTRKHIDTYLRYTFFVLTFL